jgi:hypothetical protein
LLPALFRPVLERRFAAAIAKGTTAAVAPATAAPMKESPRSVESVGAASAAESR